jgi:F-type H+-transporting ATPase subunit b
MIFVVLRAWVYKPLLGLLEKRKLAIAKGLEDAMVASEARANAEREAGQINNQAQVKSAEVLRDANEKADAIVKEKTIEAEGILAAKRIQLEAELEQERNRMLAELRGEVASLAIAAAQHLIHGSLEQDRQKQEALLQEFFAGIRGGKVVVLAGSDLAGEMAEVTSALPLTPAEQETVKKDVLSRLGGGGTVTFRIDPKILGGLVVRVGDKLIDGSVTGQLQALRQSLQ